MRRAARFLVTSASALLPILALPRAAAAECTTPTGSCVDAEPLWLTPSSRRFTLLSDAPVAPSLKLAASGTFTFRWRPGVLNAPAPNREGRDVNVVSSATDLSLGLRFGIGQGMELTLALPAGLYQRGAGIKGITYQSAPAIPEQGLHDPRLGFGFALPLRSNWLSAKLRFELKLPLGSEQSLAGEQSFVSSPSLVGIARGGGFFGGAELGVRLRQPSEFYGSRVGSQASVALGAGYELPRPRLALSVEAYALPSLIAQSATSYLPAEWLATLQLTPESQSWPSFGLGGGGGLPFSVASGESFNAFGVPAFRLLAFARFTPD